MALKLYNLHKKYEGWDEVNGYLILAENEAQARQLASDTDCVYLLESPSNVWLDEYRSTISQVDLSLPGIVFEAFKPG